MVSQRQLFLRHVAQTSGHSLSFEIQHAEGIYFIDRKGERFVDLVSGVSVSALGHGHPEVKQAIREQVDRYTHTMVYGEFVQSPQVRYAQWLAERLPDPLDNVFFVNSGSEAIEGAMKLAKRHTGRPRICAFRNAYHGGTYGALSLLGEDTVRSGFLPLLPGIRHLPFNQTDSLDQIDQTVAGVVIEPIQAESGILEPENGFLGEVANRCRKAGALLIMDEIQTGMGRTGKRFAFEHYGAVPDILCLAKSFGGGMPLGAFISSAEQMRSLAFDPPLGHITTFGGHPVSCAAGLAAQRVVERENLAEHALRMEERYRLLLDHPLIEKVRGKGLFLSVVLRKGKDVGKFISLAYRNGLIIDRFLFSDDAFRIAPPLIITAQQVDETATALLRTLDELGS